MSTGFFRQQPQKKITLPMNAITPHGRFPSHAASNKNLDLSHGREL